MPRSVCASHGVLRGRSFWTSPAVPSPLLLASRRYLALADDDAPYSSLLTPLRQLGEEQLARLVS
jgi:hypothetical protein